MGLLPAPLATSCSQRPPFQEVNVGTLRPKELRVTATSGMGSLLNAINVLGFSTTLPKTPHPFRPIHHATPPHATSRHASLRHTTPRLACGAYESSEMAALAWPIMVREILKGICGMQVWIKRSA